MVTQLRSDLDDLELQVFLSGPQDKRNCILSINAGAGGTESCDWANMLLRMYQRWCELREWKVELTVPIMPGETTETWCDRADDLAEDLRPESATDC